MKNDRILALTYINLELDKNLSIPILFANELSSTLLFNTLTTVFAFSVNSHRVQLV